ncbi:hypothetical protein KZZ52_01900 [Dactylosporangium sp. AC04546]|uniref:hypothetical protein n=1 Tax=Dactylosporangium sp. AC04546 TaxID=2862460 RepID=UPI001EE02FAA|nr:hypothetical protein [Dactylosporangium sp. AC04546]WVK84212.1 hypothetical protein KZZ52_01900 [Dactylosporangium sp. AC04546]
MGAAPVAPYDVFTINGRHSLLFDGSGPQFSIQQSTSDSGSEVVFLDAASAEHNWSALITSQPGQKFAPGTYPTNRGVGTDGKYGLDVFGDGQSCGEDGTITIKSVSRDSAGKITSLALWYHQTGCVWGEIRWHSADGYVDGLQDQTSLGLLSTGLGLQSAAQTVTFTSVGSGALKPGALTIEGAAASSFGVGANGCTGKTLAYGQTCSVSVYSKPQVVGDLLATLKIADNSSIGYRTVPLTSYGHKTAKGNFFPLGPTRILDTRMGTGAPKGKLGAKQSLSLQVANVAWVPPIGVSAVVLNVTVTNPTSASYLTAYPSGSAVPTASNLNFTAGWTGANSVTVPLGANGKVNIYNAGGSVDVIADVLGFYQSADNTLNGDGGQYQPHDTVRLADTREPGWGGPLPGGYYLPVVVDYDTLNPHVRALAVNITAVSPKSSGYLTAWNGMYDPPLASTLNFTAGAVVPNFAVVPISSCTLDPSCYGMPMIGVYNGSGFATHVVVDIVGFFDDSQIGPGMRFHPLTPTRIADTRSRLGGAGTLGPASTATLTAPAPAAVDETFALVANITGVNNGGGPTYLTAWESGQPRPWASNLNLAPYEVRPNAAFVPLGPGNKYNVYNGGSNVDVVVDVAGRFDFYPYPLQAGAQADGGSTADKAPTARAPYRYIHS